MEKCQVSSKKPKKNSKKKPTKWVSLIENIRKRPKDGKWVEIRLSNEKLLKAKYWRGVGYVSYTPVIHRVSWWDVMAWRYCELQKG